ncbi:hypothetical protein L2E82_28445 [Cichorium intybus]|uniref:Uncharacterized protein n=1 Tax=Cichorium intybus TaxID=13427 RepID=A0ACB9CVS4_CICIN|nr:hypothetical protein L2E82_28445 [Cichorium intybus]
MVPSLQFFTLPCVTSFYSGSSRSNRLKPRLEKGDRRVKTASSCQLMPMDIGVPASVDVNNCHGLYVTPESIQNLSVDKLERDVPTFLNIQDDKDGVPGSKLPQGKYEKCFSNPTTFPFSNKSTSSPGESLEAITGKESTPCDNPKSVHPTSSHSPSLPIASKPVSAIKGSREKRGETPPQKLTVKWAPEVYDPVPTSVSHTVTNNKPQKQTKKSSKSKQKNGNKSSSGSKYKDKKRGRKRGGTSSTAGFKPPEQEEEVVVDYGMPPPTAMEFDVGNPDQFCGTSFLKRYDTNQVHYPSLRL